MPRPQRSEALIRNKKTGIYELHLPGRKHPISSGAKDYDEALQWRAQLKNRVEAQGKNTGKLTLHQCLNFYENNHVNVPGKVVDPDKIKYYLNRFRDPKDPVGFPAGMYPSELLALDENQNTILNLWLDKVRAQTVGNTGRRISKGTVLAFYRNLMAGLNHCAKPENTKATRITMAELPGKSTKPLPGEPKRVFLTQERSDELGRALIAHKIDSRWLHRCGRPLQPAGCLPPLYLLWAIGKFTGRRRAAIEALQWSWAIDWKAFDGMGKINFLPPGQTETKKKRGNCPIPPDLLPILKRAYAERINDYVLTTPQPWDRLLKTACREAGFEEVTAHVLKHSFVSWAIQNNVSFPAIAEIVQTSEQTLRRTYGHWNDTSRVDTMLKIHARPRPSLTLVAASA